ncbi:MAG: DUF4118 domain-containing protein, partial [Clostridia bacterium]
MTDVRKTPEEYLETAENEQRTCGHLKIFFGYAAGVGKTYAMLAAAHDLQTEGIDVVVGYVEPHTRPQTMALLQGLAQLPPLAIEHKGITLREFDLDGAIKRRPQLVLVDELAHTNAGACRHRKRYQDVDELLRMGIDVYTTVNVQHIESLHDIVAALTGVMVRERIPDKMFDLADQIELVDIEPQELIARLNEGKIYKEPQAEKALHHFFTLENLAALREIALRRTADHINQLNAKTKPKSAGDFRTDEHILVCLSSSPSNAKIIRAAARMAAAFRGRFTALFVENSSFAAISDENRERLRGNTRLAQQLGARIETVCGDDIPFQITEFARLSGVSDIVVGRSNSRRRLLFPSPTFTERLTALAPNLDIHVIPDGTAKPYRNVKARKNIPAFSIADVLKVLLVLTLATLLGLLFRTLGFSEANIIMVYILGVLITAIVTSHRIYSLISSVLSVMVFNFFFTEPFFTLLAYGKDYPVTFLIMFLSAFITGNLVTKIQRQATLSAQTAHRTKVLLETNQLLERAK